MSLPSVRSVLIVLFFATWATPSRAAGDAEAMKLITSAMETDFLHDEFDAADEKLMRAESVCRRKTCEPSLYAGIYGYLAVISWVADQDKDKTVKYLTYMLQLDPREKLDKDYAPADMEPLLKKAQQQLRGSATQDSAPSAGEPEEKVPSAAEQRANAIRIATEKARAAKEERQNAARTAADERKDAARSAAEEKRAAQRQAAEDARSAAEEKKEAARVAAEEKRDAARAAAEDARKAAEDKKEAARVAAEEARKAAEDKKEAARKAAEDKKEAARKAAEDKKEAARKAVEDARIAAEEKKEAARKAAEEKKAEIARKAEEARVAEIDKRMRTPPPPAKLVEEPWKGQALGYPILVRVKLPPPPPKIEPERVAVVKVVTEFSGPGVPVSTKVELKPNKDGAYEGSLPCDVSKQEGDVTYYTTAYNKYDNVVASSGSINKPNQVQIKAELASRLAHMPGELPPISCEESARRAKAAAPKCEGDGCNQNVAVAATGPICEGKDCGGAAPNLPTIKPSGRGCLRCVLGTPKGGMDWEPIAGLGVAVAYFARRRVRRAA
jgi:hypothetical protein